MYAISRALAERLRRGNDLSCEVLDPRFTSCGGYRCDEYGDYVFFPSRITPLKRQSLAIEAIAHVRYDVRLVRSRGHPTCPSISSRSVETVASNRTARRNRVELYAWTWIDEERKRELYVLRLTALDGTVTPYGGGA